VAWLIVALIPAVALSACGSSLTPGVLTQSDIPSHLGVKLNPAESASEAQVRSAPCKVAASVVFDGSKKPYSPTITSVGLSCASISQAQQYFNTTKVGGNGYPLPGVRGHSVPGIGDDAWFIDQGRESDLRFYTLVWRQGDRVSLVSVEGPVSDKRITPGLAELLARRVAARS